MHLSFQSGVEDSIWNLDQVTGLLVNQTFYHDVFRKSTGVTHFNCDSVAWAGMLSLLNQAQLLLISDESLLLVTQYVAQQNYTASESRGGDQIMKDKKQQIWNAFIIYQTFYLIHKLLQ